MNRTARLGTLMVFLAMVGCGETHSLEDDAGTTDPPDGGGSSCSAGESGTLGGGVGFDGSLDETPRAGTVTEVAADAVVVGAGGESFRFRWLGPSIADDFPVGTEVTLYRADGFDVLDGPGVGLRAFRSFGFVAPPGLLGTPLAIPDGPTVMWVEGCTFTESSGGCDQPPSTVTVYDLDVDGTRISGGEQAEGSDFVVFHHGAAQFPGYGSDMCVVEAGFGAKLAARVVLEDALDSCVSIEAEYRDLLADHVTCTSDSECVVLSGQCGVGLGGCYEVANADLSSQLEALGTRYADMGCTSGVCDCAEPPTAFCNMGGCLLAP